MGNFSGIERKCFLLKHPHSKKVENCWPTEPLSGSSSFQFSTTFSLREVILRFFFLPTSTPPIRAPADFLEPFFLPFWLGRNQRFYRAFPLTFANLLSKRSSTQFSSTQQPNTIGLQVYIITAGVFSYDIYPGD